jgi:uncharacterized membrane protein
VSMSFPGYCGPGISSDIIIYFRLLHNQEGRFKIISIIGHVLCVLLFKKGFMPSILIEILIFLGSMANSGFRESMFHHYVTSAGCLIILTSCLCFSLCHCNNSDSLFANQCFKQKMVGNYQSTFLDPHFLLFLLQFLSSPLSFLRLNRSSPQIGYFSRSSYSGPRYRMQSFFHVWIFSTSKSNGQIICFAS